MCMFRLSAKGTHAAVLGTLLQRDVGMFLDIPDSIFFELLAVLLGVSWHGEFILVGHSIAHIQRILSLFGRFLF